MFHSPQTQSRNMSPALNSKKLNPGETKEEHVISDAVPRQPKEIAPSLKLIPTDITTRMLLDSSSSSSGDGIGDGGDNGDGGGGGGGSGSPQKCIPGSATSGVPPRPIIDEAAAEPKKLGWSVQIELPNESDVLFGRGKPYQGHSGNRNLRQTVEKYKTAYAKARRYDKLAIAEEIIKGIQGGRWGSPGRFLRRPEDGEDHWVEVSDATAREKVSHTLRGKRRKGEEQQPFKSSMMGAKKDSTMMSLYNGPPGGASSILGGASNTSCLTDMSEMMMGQQFDAAGLLNHMLLVQERQQRMAVAALSAGGGGGSNMGQQTSIFSSHGLMQQQQQLIQQQHQQRYQRRQQLAAAMAVGSSPQPPEINPDFATAGSLTTSGFHPQFLRQQHHQQQSAVATGSMHELRLQSSQFLRQHQQQQQQQQSSAGTGTGSMHRLRLPPSLSQDQFDTTRNNPGPSILSQLFRYGTGGTTGLHPEKSNTRSSAGSNSDDGPPCRSGEI